MLKYILNAILILAVGFVVGRYFYMKPKHINGERPPAISAQLQDGQTFQLKDLQGQFVLIDFWGSWCGPCRGENPSLVKLYEKYNQARFEEAKGFEIVSVGIEQNSKRWQRAIEKDGLSWPYHILDQASNLRFFDSPIAADFGVKQVPTKYLINPDGIIMGVNLSVEEMDKMLAKRLTSN
ncbi:MAG: TlpA disulfide reductase family protein [Bacteroidota bacterium]